MVVWYRQVVMDRHLLDCRRQLIDCPAAMESLMVVAQPAQHPDSVVTQVCSRAELVSAHSYPPGKYSVQPQVYRAVTSHLHPHHHCDESDLEKPVHALPANRM